jgi:hypothetical protein
MPIVVGLLVFGALVGIALPMGRRLAREDRRRIMAEGVSGQAEITQMGPPSPNGGSERAGSASLFYVTYTLGNSLRWLGGGDVLIEDAVVSFRAQQRRPFWFSKRVQCDFPLDHVFNVEHFDAIVRLEITDTGGEVRKLQFETVNSETAASLAKLLPTAKTQSFAPLLAEGAAFNSALLALTPNTPVTLALIALNVLLFLVATYLNSLKAAEVIQKYGYGIFDLTQVPK